MVKNLRLLRTRNGISQLQLANILGVSQQSINKYENHNIEPDIETLIAMANYFGTSVDYLIGNTDRCVSNSNTTASTFKLTEDEAHIVAGYRLLSKKEKLSILALIDTYLSPEE